MRPADEWDQTVLSQRRQLLILGFLMLTGILNYLDRVRFRSRIRSFAKSYL